MKANDFVRFSGLKAFRNALSNPDFKPNMHLVVREHECEFVHDVKPDHGSFVFAYGDVKQMVESHDLVESLGGLDEARKVMGEILAQPNHKYKANFEKPVLTQAIADVESCQ